MDKTAHEVLSTGMEAVVYLGRTAIETVTYALKKDDGADREVVYFFTQLEAKMDKALLED